MTIALYGTYVFKKNLNASKPSEHPPQVEECLKVYVGTLAVRAVVFYTCNVLKQLIIELFNNIYYSRQSC